MLKGALLTLTTASSVHDDFPRTSANRAQTFLCNFFSPDAVSPSELIALGHVCALRENVVRKDKVQVTKTALFAEGPSRMCCFLAF